MAKHHVVLTHQEFVDLQQSEWIRLEDLPIAEHEKDQLMQQAMEKQNIQGERIPIVICNMVDDAVVCIVIK